MAHVRQETAADRLRQRVCLACGYRGPEVQLGQGTDVFVCPACGCDLYARPPRSYAEMELVGVSPRVHMTAREWMLPRGAGRGGERVLGGLRRWVRGVFGALFGAGESGKAGGR